MSQLGSFSDKVGIGIDNLTVRISVPTALISAFIEHLHTISDWLYFITKTSKKVDFHFKLNSLSTYLTDLSTCCGKLLEGLSVMENNWIVRGEASYWQMISLFL